MGDGLDHFEADEFAGQQAQAPPRLPRRWCGAGEGDQVGLLAPIQDPVVDAVGALAR